MRLVLILSNLLSLTVGVLITLLITGSIRSHHVDDGLRYHPKDGRLESPLREGTVTRSPHNEADASQNSQAVGISDPFEMFSLRTEELLVMPENSGPEDALKAVLNEAKALPSVVQGSGSKDLYVFFDPLCNKCHEMYRSLANGGADRMDLTVHWIPSLVFYDQPIASLLSHKLMAELVAGRTDVAFKALDSLMLNSDSSLVSGLDSEITRDVSIRVGRSATVVRIIAQGTPSIVYETNNGKIEAFGGIPLVSDYNEIKSR